MAKVLSAIPKTYEKDGETKTLYNVALQKDDGSQVGATSFEKLMVGDEVKEDRIHPGKKEGEWVIWSEKKGGGKGSWQRNDKLIVAQCAAKMVVDLAVAGKINPVKLEDYQASFINFAKAILATEAAISGTADTSIQPAGKVASKPTAETHNIKSMGELRKAIADTYPTCKTVAAQDAILGDKITDYDAAFKKVAEYFERAI